MFVRDEEGNLVEGVPFVLLMLGKDALAFPSARMRSRFTVVLVVGDVCCVYAGQ